MIENRAIWQIVASFFRLPVQKPLSWAEVYFLADLLSVTINCEPRFF